MRILLVEDDPALASALVELLEDECYAVDLATNGSTADDLVSSIDYDLVVLDWSIPPPTGIELLTHWRADGRSLPVLMLTGRGQLADRVSGLDSGADDYLVKPFASDELLARVRSLLRRRHQEIDELAAGDLRMDRATRAVTVGGRPVRLTAKEFGVLEYLLTRLERPVSRAELAEHVWDHASDPLSNTLDVIVYRVRKKIDGSRSTKLLHTVPGVGYALSAARRAPGHREVADE